MAPRRIITSFYISEREKIALDPHWEENGIEIMVLCSISLLKRFTVIRLGCLTEILKFTVFFPVSS